MSTNTQKKNCLVEETLKRVPSYSNREIAKVCNEQSELGISHTFVGKVRRRLGIAPSKNRNRYFRKAVKSPGNIIVCIETKNESEIEKAIEKHIAANVHQYGRLIRRQHSTVAGPVDIVTNEAIIEIKQVLDRESIFKAIGQVLVYRFALGQETKRAVIIAGGRDSVALPVIECARKMGIEIKFWNGNELMDDAMTACINRLVKELEEHLEKQLKGGL